jgi:hypothetical protein
MKADYDSEADAIMIDLVEVDQWDHKVMIDDADYCGVAFLHDKPVSVTLRYPKEEIGLLGDAARRFDLNELALRATTHAALAAPDHLVTVDVDPQVLAGSGAPSRVD